METGTTSGDSLRSALRLGWAILAILLFAAFYGGSAAWLLLAGIPWLTGAFALLRSGWSASAAQSWTTVSRYPLVRACVVCLWGVVGLIAILFSAAAAVLAVTWIGAAALVAGAFDKTDALKGGLVGGCVLALTLCVTLGVAEAVFRLPALQRQFGLPDELAAWDQRYDQVEIRNVLGLRSEYEVVPKESATLRILALGDSYTWGDKIAVTDSTWPAILERRLRVRWPSTQVINMGRRGYTMANEAELLSRLGWQMCPDLVIIQFNWNDVLPSGPDFARVGSRWLYAPKRLLPVRFRSGLAASSAFLGFLDRQLDKIWRKLWPPRTMRDLYRSDFVGWSQVQSAVSYVGESSSSRSVPVLFVLQPTLLKGSWTVESYPLRDIFERVEALAADNGLKVLDLTPTFAQAGGDWERWHATPYDRHPGPDAHALTAAAIAELIEQDAWWVSRETPASGAVRGEAADGPACKPIDERAFVP